MEIFEREVKQPICDFCSAPGVGNTYVSESFSEEVPPPGNLKSMTLGYSEQWNACLECSKFIDAGDWYGLTERSLRENSKGKNYSWAKMQASREMLRGLYEKFRKGFKGRVEHPTETPGSTIMIYDEQEVAGDNQHRTVPIGNPNFAKN